MEPNDQSADLSVPGDSSDACWKQLEELVAGLHDLARSVTRPVEFYRPMLQQVVELLAAFGGMVWIRSPRGEWDCLCHVGRCTTLETVGLAEDLPRASENHQRLLDRIARGLDRSAEGQPFEPAVLIRAVDAHGKMIHHGEPVQAVHLLSPVCGSASTLETGHGDPFGELEQVELSAHVVVEIHQRPGCPLEVQQGWQRLLSTVCLTAADYHREERFRRLRAQQRISRQSVELLRRVHRSVDLKQTAYEVVNEGRRWTSCDRLSLLLARGKTWRLLAVSGAFHIERRADVVALLQQLARQTAGWGEAICWSDHRGVGTQNDLPAELSQQIDQVVDQSHVRQLVVVPMQLEPSEEDRIHQGQITSQLPDGVLVAEWFTVSRDDLSQETVESVQSWRQPVVEVAQLCGPALRQAVLLDRFPIRFGQRLARLLDQLVTPLGLRRSSLVFAGLLALVAALVWIPCDYEVLAPAVLQPRIEQDLFATCDGTVVEVCRQHGDRVDPGDVLAVLDDPGLTLQIQQVLGEIETVQKQFDAVLVTRTDRPGHEEATQDGLPWSAHQQRLSQRLANLNQQCQLLDQRREALMLRSPIGGQLLTLDAGHRLLARPVRRGEVLLTVADLKSGWRLEADLPQDRLGVVLTAQKKEAFQSGSRLEDAPACKGEGLPVRFRLADDSGTTYTGRVKQISATTMIDTRELTDQGPPIRVDIHVDAADLPTGRPGMTAEVRIACGRRSLGYVWLNDLWEAAVRWFLF